MRGRLGFTDATEAHVGQTEFVQGIPERRVMSKRRATKRTRALESAATGESLANRALQLRVTPAAVLAGLQRDIDSLADRIDSLPRRFIVSQGASCEGSQQMKWRTAAGREAALDCGLLKLRRVKALESAAEEARVRATQLDACAVLLEDEAEGEAEVAVVARALLSLAASATSPGVVAITWGSAASLLTIEAALWMRIGVDPSRCTLSGDGLHTYLAGDFDNKLSLVAADGEGDVVDSIDSEDVSVLVEGGSVARIAVGEAGVVEVVYHMPEGSVAPTVVSVSVCGLALQGAPWTATQPLSDSAILATVASECRVAFLWELTSNWLPRRTYSLLYRGSRDGMNAHAFHSLCDGKGPTLVLIRCDKGFVFGGYAGASWESPSKHTKLASPDAFLLSVFGPFSSSPVRFPVMPAAQDVAVRCDSTCGPLFTGGFDVRAGRVPPHAFSAEASMCFLGMFGGQPAYEDVLGKGQKSFTGGIQFRPAEMEVFAVKRMHLS